jgi:hypothetical protein
LDEHDKVNFHGCIPGDSLAIAFEGYTLRTNLVVRLPRQEPSSGPRTVALRIRLHWKDGETELSPLTPVLTVPPGESRPVVAIIGIEQVIATGKLSFDLFVDNMLRLTRSYTVEIGDAPVLGGPSKMPLSTILGKGKTIDLGPALKAATISLEILDQYLPANELHALLQNVPASATVRIITFSKAGAAQYATAWKALPGLPLKALEIRLAQDFHDRFVIANDTAFYHFGHSIKDMHKNKISRFSQVATAGEKQVLRDEFKSAWATGTPVPL